MRLVSRSLMGLFLLAATLGLLVFAGTNLYQAVQMRLADEGVSRPARERVISVNVVRVDPQTIAPEFATFGEVVSRRSLELRAPEAGTILRVGDKVAEGAILDAGDLIAQIDPTDAQSTLALAGADLSEAEAELRDALRALDLSKDTLTASAAQADLRERALTRQQDLSDRGVGTSAAVEAAELAASSARQTVLAQSQAVANAEARIDRARTAVTRRQIAVAEAERRLEDLSLRAEFPGALANVALVAGSTVSNNERLAELIDPNALEVSFRVSTGQYRRLIGPDGTLTSAEVSVSLDLSSGAAGTVTTKIGRESASVGEGQTGRVLFAPLPGGRGFRPGDFVDVNVTETPLERVALLPATAVDSDGGLLALGEGDRLEYLPSEILRRQGDAVILSVRGIAGREVVAERSPLLGAGIRIAPVRPLGEGEAEAPEAPAMIALDDARRAKLIAFVEANTRMPAEARDRVLSQLGQPEVPAQLVDRLESRMGS